MPRQDIVSEREAREEELRKELIDFLVPDWEYPYKIPNNWVWVYLGSIFTTTSGGTPSKKVPQYYINGTIPWLLSGEVNRQYINHAENFITEAGLKNSSAKLFSSNTLLVAMYGATAGQVGILTFESSTNQAVCGVLPNSYISTLYLYYYFKNHKEKLVQQAYGAAQPNLSQEKIKEVPLPLPPLAEQERIVKEIERLFSELDKAREIIENILDTFQNRKSAILHKAFSGELTKKWREERDLSLDTWEETTLEKYINTQYGYTESANKDKVGPKFLRITDIQNSQVNWSLVPYCPINDTNKNTYLLKQGDIVVARTGATTGKSYLIEDDIDAVFASYLIRISIINSTELIEQYLYKFMQSTMYWNQITDLKQGIAQPGVNAIKLKQLVLLIPSLAEQEEIVRILDDTLQKEDNAKELTDILEQIDLMKKTILAKAFRGELNTNNPDEESALGLLKEILAMPTPKKERVQIKGI
jgi:type I restriction enzyme S subunit